MKNSIAIVIFMFFYTLVFAEPTNSFKKQTLTIKKQYLDQIKSIQEIMNMGKYDIALSKVEPLLKKYLNYPEAFILSGDCLTHLGSFNEAYQEYLKALYIDSNSITYDKIREVLNKKENSKLITIKLKRTINSRPNDFVLRNILSSFYIQLGLYKDALSESNKVLSIHPWDTYALLNISLANIYQGNFTESETYMNKAIKHGASSDLLHFIKAYLALKRDQDYKTAEKELIAAIKINPYAQSYYYTLAYIYMLEKKFENSTALLQNATVIDPKNKKVVLALAQSYFLSGDTDRALEVYQKLTRIAPTSVEGYLGLGKIYLQLNQYQKTIEYFKMALKFDKTTLKFVNFLELYFQKYFYIIAAMCFIGIFLIVWILKKNKEIYPKL